MIICECLNVATHTPLCLHSLHLTTTEINKNKSSNIPSLFLVFSWGKDAVWWDRKKRKKKMFKNQIFTYVFPMFTIEICKSNHTSLLSNNMNFKFMFTAVCDSFVFFATFSSSFSLFFSSCWGLFYKFSVTWKFSFLIFKLYFPLLSNAS